MSRAYFNWQEAILKSKLEPTTKLVCHTICCHMAADDRIYPGQMLRLPKQ
jgi:hypothetical protein